MHDETHEHSKMRIKFWFHWKWIIEITIDPSLNKTFNKLHLKYERRWLHTTLFSLIRKNHMGIWFLNFFFCRESYYTKHYWSLALNLNHLKIRVPPLQKEYLAQKCPKEKQQQNRMDGFSILILVEKYLSSFDNNNKKIPFSFVFIKSKHPYAA